MNTSSMVIMRAICILPHFSPFSLINLFIQFWIYVNLLLFLDYLFTFNIDEEAAFWLSYGLGETSRKDPSEFLKKLERFWLRATGETEGCDNYFASNFYSLLRSWLKNLLLGNLLKYGSWVNLFNCPLSEGENGGLKTFCFKSLDGVGNMSDNKYKAIVLMYYWYNLEFHVFFSQSTTLKYIDIHLEPSVYERVHLLSQKINAITITKPSDTTKRY